MPTKAELMERIARMTHSLGCARSDIAKLERKIKRLERELRKPPRGCPLAESGKGYHLEVIDYKKEGK